MPIVNNNINEIKMKQQSVEFFRNLPKQKTEQFNAALDLYRKSTGHIPRQLQHFNNLGYSEARLESLFYELKKLHNITEKDIKLAPVILAVDAQDIPAEAIKTIQEALASSTGIIVTGQKPEITLDNVFTEASDDIKTDIKLRSEFAFLNSLKCPDEFKILVADKLTHYHAYVEAHRALMVTIPEEGQEPAALTNDEIFALAEKAVENFTVNQEIYDELDHYKKTGEILGRHPVFRYKKTRELIYSLSPKQLSNKPALLVNYINRANNEIKKTQDPDRIAKLQEKIETWKTEQKLVEERLSANESK